MNLRDAIASWTCPDTDAATAATSLTEHLLGQGLVAHRMATYQRLTGLSIVFVGEPDETPTLILVAPGSTSMVRQTVWQYVQLPIQQEHHRGLASAVSAPDIDQLVWGELADLEVALVRAGFTPSLRIADVDRALERAGPLLAQHLDLKLDPDAATACAQLDRLVHRLRPFPPDTPIPEGCVWPPATLAALGLLAQVATLRSLGGRAQWGRIEPDGAFVEVDTLGEADMVPATLLGNRSFSLPKRLYKLWMSGSTDSRDSLASLFGSVQAVREPEGVVNAVVVATLKTGLALAGQQLALMACNLDEGTPCVPTTLALVEGRAQMSYLQVPDSGAAVGAFGRLLEGELATAHCASLVVDGFWDGGDALLATVADPLTGQRLEYVMPYVRNAQGLHFDATPLLLRQLPDLDQQEADRIVLEPMVRMEEPVIRRLLASRGVESQAQPRPLEVRQRSRRELAGIGASAVIARIGQATGRPFEEVMQVFSDALGRGELDALRRLLYLTPLRPSHAMRASLGDPSLAQRSIVALGMLCRSEPEHAVGLDQLRTLVASLVELGGSSALMVHQVEELLAIDFPGDLGEAPQPDDTDLSASLAIPAALLVVLARKGSVTTAELRTLLEVAAATTGTLAPMVGALGDTLPSLLSKLQDHPELIQQALLAFGRLAPPGTGPRVALLELVDRAARAIRAPTSARSAVAELLDPSSPESP